MWMQFLKGSMQFMGSSYGAYLTVCRERHRPLPSQSHLARRHAGHFKPAPLRTWARSASHSHCLSGRWSSPPRCLALSCEAAPRGFSALICLAVNGGEWFLVALFTGALFGLSTYLYVLGVEKGGRGQCSYRDPSLSAVRNPLGIPLSKASARLHMSWL